MEATKWYPPENERMTMENSNNLKMFLYSKWWFSRLHVSFRVFIDSYHTEHPGEQSKVKPKAKVRNLMMSTDPNTNHHIFPQMKSNKQTNKQTNERKKERTNEGMNQPTNQPTNQTNKQTNIDPLNSTLSFLVILQMLHADHCNDHEVPHLKAQRVAVPGSGSGCLFEVKGLNKESPLKTVVIYDLLHSRKITWIPGKGNSL